MKNKKIRIAVVGFGKLGKACIEHINMRPQFELVAVFSRRAIADTIPLADIQKYTGKIDVVLVCVGSSEDAPAITPQIARNFNTVDSFDTHSNLSLYIEAIKHAHAEAKPHTNIVAAGWDPGLFSLLRIYLTSFMPSANVQTFWGKGVSMGHTNAIKSINGVEDAIQFTVPKSSAIIAAKKGIPYSPKAAHRRVCYVVAPAKEQYRIEHEIKIMPNYFKGYETEVNFVTPKEFSKKYRNRVEHAGQIIATDNNTSIAFTLKMKENPHFTANILLAFAMANICMQKDNLRGVFTIADIAPQYLLTQYLALI